MPRLRARSVASECLERRGRLQADQNLLGVTVRQAAMNDLDVETRQVRGRRCRVDLTASCRALELRHRSPPSGRGKSRQSQSTRRGDRSIQVMMTEELTKKVVVWATEIATYAAELPSRRARDAYLAERRRELEAGAVAEGAAERDAAILADACVSAARRIMTELLAQRAGVPRGRA